MYGYFVAIFLLSCASGLKLRYNLTQGSCPNGFFQCQSGEMWRHNYSLTNNQGYTGTMYKCFSLKQLCDKEPDCSDSSDEKYCEDVDNTQDGHSFQFIQGPCPFDYVMCKSGKQMHTSGVLDKRCISKARLCNNSSSCYDNSDETFCPYDLFKGFHYKLETGDCPEGYYRCKTGSPKYPPLSKSNKNCIPKHWICNKISDCSDGSDEKFCPYLFLGDRISSMGNEQESLKSKEELNISGVISTYQTIAIITIVVAIINTFIVLAATSYVLYNARNYRLEYITLQQLAGNLKDPLIRHH